MLNFSLSPTGMWVQNAARPGESWENAQDWWIHSCMLSNHRSTAKMWITRYVFSQVRWQIFYLRFFFLMEPFFFCLHRWSCHPLFFSSCSWWRTVSASWGICPIRFTVKFPAMSATQRPHPSTRGRPPLTKVAALALERAKVSVSYYSLELHCV